MTDVPPVRRCFVLSPIGSAGTPERARADGVLDAIIRPALEQAYDVSRADDDRTPGMITDAIIRKIRTADLIVADLTGLNANVVYELAVAHAVGKPVIQLMEEGGQLPFDISPVNTIFFRPNLAHWRATVAAIRQAESAVVLGDRGGNPIQQAIQFEALVSASPPDLRVVLEALNSLRADIAAIRDSSRLPKPATDPESGLPRSDPMTVLIADPEPVMNPVLARMVQIEGHAAVVVRNARELVKQARGNPPDAVLVSLELPWLTPDLVAVIRRINREVTFIVTTHNESAEVPGFIREGHDWFLRKPFTPQQLRAALDANRRG